MDWWEYLVVCTAVFVIVCRSSEGTLLDNDDVIPGTHQMIDGNGCPPNTLFCMESFRCVNLDGTCIKPPTCEPWEVLQENKLGVYACVSIEDTCWPEMEEACDVYGVVKCVPQGQCSNLKVTLTLSLDFQQFVDVDYKQTATMLMEQISSRTGLSHQQLLYFKLTKEPTRITFRAPLSSSNQFSTVVNTQFLRDKYNNTIIINWPESIMEENNPLVIPFEKPIKEPKYCKLGQIYCFQEGRCVNMDGTCPTEPSCDQHQMLCNKDGTLTCVDAGTCTHVEVGMYLESADYFGVVGQAFEHLNKYEELVKKLFSNNIPGSELNDFYDIEVKPGPIYITLSASQRLYNEIQNMVLYSHIQFMTDLSDQQLLINYEKSYVELKQGYHLVCMDGTCTTCSVDQETGDMTAECMRSPEYNPSDYDEKDDGYSNEGEGFTCGYNEIFCVETMSCVTQNGHCPHPDCGVSQKVCYIDDSFVCTPSCTYSKFVISIEGNFFEIVGSLYERYNIVKESLTEQLAESLVTTADSFIESYIWNGSLNFGGKMPYEFLYKLQNLIEDKSLRLYLDEKQMNINFTKSLVYEETEYGDDYYDDDNDSDDKDRESCPECKNDDMTCGENEIFCIESGGCVNKDGSCIHKSYDCPYNEIPCDDRNGGFICKPIGSCDIDNGGYPGKDDDEHSITCPTGQIFCVETMSCVTLNGHCPHPDCGVSQKVCYIDDSFVCTPSCTYSKFVISMEGNFFEISGSLYERYNIVKESLTEQLAESLVTTADSFIESYIWNGSLNFGGKMPYEFLYKLQNLIEDKSLRLYLDEKQMNINFTKSFVYEETEYGYDYYDDDNNSDDKDRESCPECKNDDMTCGENEIFCIESGGCVNKDGSCIYKSYDCPYNEIPCDDRNGGFICKPIGSCEIDNGGYPGKDDDEHSITCPTGQIFCVETMSCVTPNGHCPHPDCGVSQKVCYIDDSFVCTPSCTYSKFVISMEGNFFEIVGSLYERYNIVKESLTEQLAESLVTTADSFIESYIWNGSLNFGGKMPYEYLYKLQNLIEDKSLRLYLDEKQMNINFTKSFVYEETEYGDDYYDDDNDSDDKDRESCPECKNDDMTCGENEIFCIESGGCVNKDGSCIYKSYDCPYNEIPCDDRNGGFICKPIGSCDIDNGGYPGKDDDESSITCPTGQIFCIESGGCVYKDGSCIYESYDCPFNEIPCDDRNGGFICKPIGSCDIDNGGYPGKDDDESSITCPTGQIFCIESGGCVNKDGSCIYKTYDCPYNEIPCDDRNGGFICKPTGSCDIDNGGYPGKDDDESSITCPTGQIFCIESGGCVNKDGSCIYKSYDCPYNEIPCDNRDGGFICKPVGLCDTDNGDYPGKDNDENSITCPTGQIYCFETGQCVKGDGTCNEEPEKCPVKGEIPCDNGNGYICKPVGSCDTDNGDGGYPGKDDNENPITCPTGQIFCIEIGGCVNPDDECDDGNNAQCDSPDEMPCDNGEGRTVCKPVGTCVIFDTTKITLTLNGNYDKVVGVNKKMAMQDIKTDLVTKLNIDPNDVTVYDIKNGSIIVFLDFMISDNVMIKAVLEKIKSLKDNKEQIIVLGNSLTVTNYTISDIPKDETNNGGGSNSGNEDDVKSIYCTAGQIYCFETGQCVKGDGTCNEEPEKCPVKGEIPCDNGNGYLCKPVGSCDTDNGGYPGKDDDENSMTCPTGKIYCFETGQCVNGNGTCNEEPEKCTVKGELPCYNDNGGFICKPVGSCDIDNGGYPGKDDDETSITCPTGQIYCFETEQCVIGNGTCNEEPEKCPVKGEIPCDNGNGYICKPVGSCDSDNGDGGYHGKNDDENSITCPNGQIFCIEIGGCVNPDDECDDGNAQCDSPDEIFCPGKNLCVPKDDDLTACMPKSNECNETHARCYNRDAESSKCVPKQTCDMKTFCPVPQPDTVSTCHITCNPMEDKAANEKGQICCPNACGGVNAGVFMEPLQYYVCPRDEDTGVCVSQPEEQCDKGMIFCPAMDTCVEEDYDFATCESEVIQCNENEVYCLDTQGFGACADSCTIRGIKIKMVTDANYEEMITQETQVIADLTPQVISLLETVNVDDSLLKDLQLFSGSLGISFTLILTDPEQAESILSQLESLVQQSKVTFVILDKEHLVKPDSFKMAVDLVVFDDLDCKVTDSCDKCGEGEAPCTSGDGNKSITCVPSYLCSLESACPLPDKETVSTCQNECNPRQDVKNSDGKLCCPSSCGGENSGLYVEPVIRYVCPVSEDTGVCLKESDTKCDTGKEWCAATFTCETEEFCKEQALQQKVDEITKSEKFIIRIPLTSNGQTFATVFQPQNTKKPLQEKVNEFANLMKEQLLNTLTSADAESKIDTVAVFPERKDTRGFSVYADVSCKTLSASDIKGMVNSLIVLSNVLEFSLDPGKHPSVTAVLGTQSNQLFVLEKPVVAKTDTALGLFSVVPRTLFTVSSVKATLDCTETKDVHVVAGESIKPTNEINSDQDFVIRHTLTDIQLVKCRIDSSQFKTLPDGVGVFISFIAIPKDVGNLGAITDIDVTKDQIQIDEDSDCMSLPDNLFSIEHEGDILFELLSNYPAQMTGNNEVWQGPVLNGLQQLFLSYILTRTAALNDFRVSVSIDVDSTGSRPAKLIYKGDPLRGTDITTLLSAEENLKHLSICVRADYNGAFNIDISKVNIGESEQGQLIKVPIMVIGKNDAPKITRKTDHLKGFTYPMVSGSDTSTEVPIFNVKELMESITEDKDGDNIGMALIGVTNEIEGKWEYSNDDGNTWNTLVAMDKQPDIDADVEVRLLVPKDKIRFTVSESNKAVTWSLEQAPTIFGLAWDGYNSDVTVDTISLEKCYTFETGMFKYCYAGLNTAYSTDMFGLSMTRDGCDGESNSGKEMGQCGCGDDSSCLDCNNKINGGAEVDKCGICGGPNTEVDCTVDECKQFRKSDCESQKEVTNIISSICKEGEIVNMNSTTLATCGMCLKEGTKPENDQCGIPCGNNECINCNGEKGDSHKLNKCGICKPINKLTENCGSDKITIGNVDPPSSIPWTVMNVSIDISGLTTDDKPDISECHLEAKEGDLATPEVSTITYVDKKKSIVLTIQANPFTGHFGIVCTINGQDASTKDNDLYLWLHDQPTLLSVEPSRSLISDIRDITISGTNFFDTGIVICVRRCLSWETCIYKNATGKRISDTKVTCPTKRLTERNIGQTHTIYIVLQKLHTVDIESVSKFSGVQFSVVLPPPSAMSAVLNKKGCRQLIVTFSTRVVGTSGHSCNNYFSAPTFDDDDKCILSNGSRKMTIEWKTPLDVGTELVFKSNVISSAAEHNANKQNVEKLSGSVIVKSDDDEEKGKPIVMIDPRTPKKVGCSPVTVRLIIRNRGCWDIDVTWIVTADGVDQEQIESLQDKLGKSTSFTITGSELQDGKMYTLSAIWTAGKYSGEDSVRIMKDTASTAALQIRGISSEQDIDVNKAFIVKAMLDLCKDDNSIPTVTWSLTPKVYTLRSDFKTAIPKGKLQPNTQYNLTCTVTTGDSEITGFVAFNTKPRAIKPQIVSNNIRPSHSDDVTLTCSDQLNPPTSMDDCDVTWSCKDNVVNELDDVNEYTPCFEFSTSENNYVAVERSGSAITLPGNKRRKTQNGLDLNQQWTCKVRRKSVMNIVYTSSIKLKFASEQIVLSAPEIKSKTPEMTYLAEGDSFTVKIRARIRKSTGCKYWTNGMDVDSESSEEILLDATKYKINGYLERDNIKYSDEIYELCQIKLNLKAADLQPAKVYVIKLFAYNRDSWVSVQNSREFKVMIVPYPTPGIIQIFADQDPIVALTTKVKVTLDGWHDDLFDNDLKCNIYYTNMNSTEGRTRINTLPVDLQGDETTLSEGQNNIEVECCNVLKKCTWKEAENIITVEPIDQTRFISVVENTLPQVLSLDKENSFTFIWQLKKAVKEKVQDKDEEKRLNNDIIQAIQNVIMRALNIASALSDIGSRLSTIEKTSELVEEPDELDYDVKESLKQNIKEVLDEAVGNGERRKKRSTTESSGPTGLSATDASIALKGIEKTISEEAMDKEDADSFKEIVDGVMVAMCINFTGSEPWLAPADRSYVRLHKTNMTEYASLQSDVSCDTCSEVDYPATVKYGSYLESYFEGIWNCTFYDTCIDVCIATAQLNIDYITLTAETEVEAPTRKSDIIILRMINPENYAVTEITDLPTSIEATLTLNATLDMDKYDYKCLMWVSENWSDKQCNTSIPTIDQTTSQYTAVCTCNALGIISIFQELKQEEKIITSTTTTTSSLTTTSTSSDAKKVTTVPLPSKQLEEGTESTKVEFRFQEDYVDSVGESIPDFNNKVEQDIIAATIISTNCIRNFKSEKGSIIITFELHQADSSLTLGQIVYKVENAITTGAITFTTPGGDPLTIKADSFIYEEIKDDDDKDDDGDESGSSNLLIIIGAALGGLVIVCVTVVVILLILKNKKQRTHPTSNATEGSMPRYATPPPAYAVTQPPPPFLYEEPPQVNKWVEDELKKDEKQRPPSGESGGSGSSYEQKLKKKGREFGPTPVGE